MTGLTTEQTLLQVWSRHWHSAAPALSSGTGWLSYEELEQSTRQLAARLTGAGLRAGQRIMISAAPGLPLVQAHVAALRMGLVVVPLNPGYGRDEVRRTAAGCRPAAVLSDTVERAGWVREAVPELVLASGVDVNLPAGVEPVLDAADPQDPALLMHTSGTSGAPKAAVLSHGALLAGVHAVLQAWHWDGDDRLVLALPLFHVHGLAIGLHGTLAAGASAVLRPRFDPADVLHTVHQHRASLFFGVPTMYARLAVGGQAAQLRRLRLAVSGSAPLSEQLHAAIAAASGQQLLERYGMTETLLTVSNPYDGPRRPGTVGLPLPGVQLRLADDGEIQVRGPSLMSGYLDDPDASAAAFTDDGWLHTGDLGSYDPHGYLRVVGRSKDLIISGGYNVHPREVEDVLRAHLGVHDVAVIGLPDADLGEQVVAVVEGGEATEAELLAHAAQALARYKRPRRAVRVDQLPRTALGKVRKEILRAELGG